MKHAFKRFPALLLLAASMGLSAAEQPPVEAPEEIVVVGRQPGPPLWRVSKGDNVLWIFPALSPIPQDMIWESDRVARVIAESQEYIAPPDIDAKTSPLLLLNPFNLIRGYRLMKRIQRNPDGATLGESLSPALFARFQALKQEYFPRNDEVEELRPLMAGNRMTTLIEEAEGLTDSREIRSELRKLLRRNRDIRRTEVTVELELEGSFRELAGRAEAMMESLSPEQEQACFEQQVRHMEEDLEHMKSRANTWAQGYVDEFRNIPLVGEEENVCLQLVLGSTEQEVLVGTVLRANAAWLQAAEAALATNRSTFAVLDINELLREDGLLGRLRAKGYVIRAP